MNRIILDYYRRWWLGIVSLLVGHLFLERYSALTGYDDGHLIKIFSCQILMFLGFILSGDLFRGQGRALAILPVTAQQIGRALWFASVLIAGAVLSIASFGCLHLYAKLSFAEIFAPAQLIRWAIFPLVLGASFGSFTLMPSIGAAPSFLDRVRVGAAGLNFIFPLAGWYYLQKQQVHPILAGLIISALAFVTVRGWLRAGQLISLAAGFRLTPATGAKRTTTPLAVSGVGGLRYLVQQTLVRFVLMGLGMMALITVVLAVMRGDNQTLDFSQTMIAGINGGLTPFIFLLLMGVVPITQQLRFLRTLPISPSTLTAVLVFLPIASLATVGMILALIIIPVAATLSPLLYSFLSIAGIAAVGMTMAVWRGLDFLTYLVLFLFIVSGPLLSMALNHAFSIRAIPPWVSITFPIVLIALSFVITRRLISHSSVAYRVRPGANYNWAQMRPS